MSKRTSLVAEKVKKNNSPNRLKIQEKEVFYASYTKKDMDDKMRYLILKVDKMSYDIPAAYSLERELHILAEVSLRTYKIRKRMCRTDMEAIANDWIKVGQDINESIRRYSKQC